jgi:putative cofactor-binding repeat protein
MLGGRYACSPIRLFATILLFLREKLCLPELSILPLEAGASVTEDSRFLMNVESHRKTIRLTGTTLNSRLFWSAFLLFFAPLSARSSTTLPIQNPSFEITNALMSGCGAGCSYNYDIGIPGWTVTGNGGSFQPSSAYLTLPPQDGQIVAYSEDGSIGQILTSTLQPNSTYTLSVDVGHRLDGLTSNYMIELLAGGNVLSSITGNSANIPAGSMATESLSYTSGATVTAGQPLEILLISAGNQSDFDNVTLTLIPSAPTITNANSATFTVGTAGTFTMTATGVPTPTWSESGALPTGVTFNTATGILAGTPTVGGTYAITIMAQNGVAPNASQNFTLTIDFAPTITSANNATFTVGTPETFTVTATGTPAPTWSESGTLPAGVTFNAATGILAGTPTATGTYPITIAAQNGVAPNASQSFTLTVNSAPAITSANTTTFTVGTAGTFTVTATGVPAPTLSAAGTLPNGMTFNAATGVLAGTPTVGGTYPITITAQNGVTPNASQIFTLEINSTQPTIPIQNPSFEMTNALMNGCGAGCSYNYDIGIPGWTVTGNGGSFQPSSAYLTLPPQDGQIVAYSEDGSIGQILTSTLQPNSIYTLSVDVGHRLDGLTTNYTIELLAGGNSLNSVTGNSANIPAGNVATQSVSYTSGATVTAGQLLEIRLISAGNQSDFDNVTLTVDSAPAITSANNATFTVGAAGAFSMTATGAPAPTWSAIGTLPNGVTLNAATGILAGTPTVSGTYPITITAQNGVAPNASQNFTLTVYSAPAITSANGATFTMGMAGTFTAIAIGAPAPTWSESGTLPAGVTFNTATGILAGTPTVGGIYPITITAQNGVLPNASQNFTLTINFAPTITNANNATFTVGTPGTFTATASGIPASTWSEGGALPNGVTLNAATGILSGTPTVGGTYPITITAQNGVAPNASQNFTLAVDFAPAITSANTATFTVGAAGTFTVTATGAPAPTWTETGTLPTGVTFNTATGILSGTPTVGGAYPITITAQNGVTPNASHNVTLTVNFAPTITSANNTTFTVGTAGTFAPTATGTPAPTWSESGTLPAGVTFNVATGVLAGTPTVGGTYPITFTAQNGVTPNASQNFTLTVNFAPTITSANNTTFTAGVAGTFTLTATGTPAATWSESGALPAGVTLDAATGILAGTPTVSGTYPITITAQNGVAPNASQNFTLTVDCPPSITSANNTTFTMGMAGTFTVVARGSPAATLSEIGTLPNGVTFNSATGVLAGTPTAGGTYPITITAQNGVMPNASQSFTLTVNSPPSITSAKKATFTVGTAGTFTAMASGTPAPTWSESGTLPNGVTFNATTGMLEGTPTVTGTYPITITAENGVAPNASQNFTLTVNSPPAITSAANATFAVGAAGTFTATATGSPAPTWSENGTLPNGVTFNATTGILSGIPTVSGRYPLTITAQNGVAPNASQDFTLDVNSSQAKIPIQNPSFETTNGMTSGCGTGCSYNYDVGIPGWTVTGNGGSFQPSSSYLTLPAQDGQVVAYSEGGTIGQILTCALQANSTYTLSVDVGHRLDGLTSNYTIELLAGGNVLSSITGNSASILAGSMATQSLSYTSGATVTAGQLLQIELISAGDQSDFDNVTLTAVTAPATLPIQNPSFETTNGMTSGCGAGSSCNYDIGIPGWTVTGNGGSFQPSSAVLTLPPQDGQVVAYSEGGMIGQILTCALQANSTYTLSVDVGHRLDGYTASYTIELLAGGNVLSSITGSSASIPAGSVATQSVSYTSGATVTAGQLLQIELISAGNQSDFDNVTLTEIPSAPTITAQPQNQLVVAGNAATFTIAVTGGNPLTYQWQRNSVNISGATSSTYTTPVTAFGDSGAQFSVVVTNPFGVASSSVVTLTVDSPPIITMSPASQTLAAGEVAVFTVNATGTQPLTYQWIENGVSIPNATSQSYTTPVLTAGNNGQQFQVVVTNSLQSVPSSTATLTVIPHSLPATYYVDYQNGSDTYSGVSKNSPWKNAPGMAACAYNCNAYTLQPGDRVIFKGGDIWSAGSFPMAISASGTSGDPIYFGVDQTWFNGNSWTRPVFDLEDATWTTAPILVNSANFVTLDNIEIRNEEIGNNTSGVFTSGISVNGGSNVTIENCYIHGWSIQNPQLGSDTFSSGGIAFYNGSTVGTVKNCVLDAGPEADSGTGIYGGSVIQGNIIENMPKGIVVDDPTANVSGNQVFNVTYSVDDPVNSTAIFAYTSANIFNNTVHDLVAGASAIYLEADSSGTGNTQAVYNNLVWNVGDDAPVTIASDNMGPASVSNQFVYNNTLDGGASAGCVGVLVNFYSPTNLTVQNNHCISDSPSSEAWCWNDANGNYDCGLVTNLTFGNNVLMSSATASAQGYAIANSFQPSLPSSATVGAGLNLSSSCTAIGISLCSDRLGIARPLGSVAWDAGAYLYQPGDNLSPAITTQPVRQAVAVGQQATFTVIATGAGPLAYQWMENGNAISGATLPTYMTPATAATDDGTIFTVVISNTAGSVMSSPATLSINTSPGQLIPSTTNLTFGPIALGASSTASIALTNESTSYVTISGISVSGAGLSASGVPSGAILAAGEVATLNVVFAPSGSGLVTGSVSIYSDAAGSPLSIPVSGTGITAPHLVTVTWNPSTSTVFGYNVYRATNQFGYYSKLNSTPITTAQYTDLAVQPGQTYFYWVTSVDANTSESTLSNPASVTVPSP